jgi:hypothetical protein
LLRLPSASISIEDFDAEAIEQEMLQTNFPPAHRLERQKTVQYLYAEDLNHEIASENQSSQNVGSSHIFRSNAIEIDILTPLVHDECKSSASHSPDAEEMC